MNNSVKLGNFEKQNSINRGIYVRHLPSSDLQANYDPRPVSTKYSTLPIIDRRKEVNIPIVMEENYNSEKIFNPATRKPHFEGFARNIDSESVLRNQFFALQAADQAQYIPSSNSDLYVNNINFITVGNNLEESGLFRRDELEDFNPNPSIIIGNELFNNSTRVQLKNLK
tara:strand:- start:110 stop:619 length:510 start_codon:yes stop_codon:yes gene_type:complete